MIRASAFMVIDVTKNGQMKRVLSYVTRIGNATPDHPAARPEAEAGTADHTPRICPRSAEQATPPLGPQSDPTS